MRGTLPAGQQTAGINGIIPAYAGNTTNDYDFDTPRRDHPRVCGEHGTTLPAAGCWTGSSPRMRGTLVFLESSYCPVGIIPAYAGNTRRWWNARSPTRDHPRVCGEHPLRRWLKTVQSGSSPRMRGTHLIEYGRTHGYGIIPAYAGNTLLQDDITAPFGDHPRVCGEHLLLSRITSSRRGSSPRMRGTLVSAHASRLIGGIIPAYAGNT